MAGANLLEALIKNNSIVVNAQAKDWQSAIVATFAPLIASKAIKNEYVQAVIASTTANGPYFILDEEVAMPHAHPEDGALQNAFSLITLQDPVVFPPDTRKIKMLIGLSAVSAEIHVSAALPQVVALLESKEAQKEIMAANNVDEVITAIKKVNLNKYLKEEN